VMYRIRILQVFVSYWWLRPLRRSTV